jgi:ribonucleoside-diphosphate reductase beta chain
VTRYSLFPVENHMAWDWYKKHIANFWTTEEVDLSKDKADLATMSPGEKHFVTHILAFFAQSDGIVNENLAIRFYKDIEEPEVRAFYAIQIAIETIHSEMYSLLIDTYVSDTEEKNRLFNATESIPVIAKKANWAMKWISSEEIFAKRLLAFAIVEGVFFSGAFCSIFWLRKRGLMPGLGVANEWISRDEGMHWQFAADLYRQQNIRLTNDEVQELVRDAVKIEQEFVRDALPVSLIGMNADSMSQYIEYVADRVLERFGFAKIYHTKNPFDFMILLDMETKTNFFEERAASYQRGADRNVTLDAAF